MNLFLTAVIDVVLLVSTVAHLFALYILLLLLNDLFQLFFITSR